METVYCARWGYYYVLWKPSRILGLTIYTNDGNWKYVLVGFFLFADPRLFNSPDKAKEEVERLIDQGQDLEWGGEKEYRRD